MTFINWSDSEEMLGLLIEFVADERSESQGDLPRRTFLTDILGQLTELSDRFASLPANDVIDQLRAIRESMAGEFDGDPITAHVDACIGELERINSDLPLSADAI